MNGVAGTNVPFYRKRIQRELLKRVRSNSQYSLRAFARAARISPGALSQILSGKRVPSVDMAERLILAANIGPTERKRFLKSLVEYRSRKSLGKVVLKNDPDVDQIEHDRFQVIADWYHYAILELSLTKDFDSRPKQIASRLGVSEILVKDAIQRLLNLGLLKKEKGKLQKAKGRLTTANKNTTSVALKKHQRQVLEKAIFSLENDPIEKRSMTSMTMAINPDKIPAAKKLIEEFTDELCELLESHPRSKVYELGITLYPLEQERNGK